MGVVDKKGRKMVAPDGGWGWVAVLGVSMVNLATRSIEPSFGLLFGDLLKKLDVATTGASVIMSTMDAVINFSGLFVGPLIKMFSYRKVALFGSVLSAVGLMLTSTANSMAHILATYSIIGGKMLLPERWKNDITEYGLESDWLALKMETYIKSWNDPEHINVLAPLISKGN